MAKDYNETINLPKTDFPMRASLPQREPDMLKAWQDNRTYEKLQELTEGRPRKVLHDGPPFSNGSIHMGTAMNRVLKDFINRYNSMSGYHSPYTPGWDNHGMPIESAIIKANKVDHRNMSIAEFRDACKDFAQNFVNIQMNQCVRLGVLGDWDDPYLTMDPAFEATEIRIFGEMYKKGYIYKGLKPVYWCPTDETALAEAEIEYKEAPCTAIYVKFAVKDDLGKLAQYGDLSRTYFVIWTTTTWTLPGNVAIALHPREKYSLVRAENGEQYIIADPLVSTTMDKTGLKYEIVAEFKGSELEFIKTQHPFLDRESVVVNADYVTMESGTGCVHTAPGFGAEDYQTGLKYKLPMPVPVDDKGYQTEEAGKFAGLKYEASNDAILADLKETGALFASEEIVHTYPHCWRCKNPIIFRATPQWFCSIDAIKDKAIAACEDVEWLPAWGQDRITGMIRERSDWCISRQRRWGLPIPVFYCDECGKPVCTEETIDKTAEMFGKEGSNAWYLKEASELVPEGFVCPYCGGKHFTKEIDTLDCWFDSGSTHFFVMDGKKQEWPADIFLEGLDQYRGWFQSSLLTAVAARDEAVAPYKTVITHGWVVDGEGKAMHKSIGNTIDPLDVIKDFGADLLRLWVASSDYRQDVRVSNDIFKQLSQAYLKIRNTARYILGNLDGFDPSNLVAPEDMEEIDRWAITSLNQLIAKVRKGYDEYEYHIAYHSIRNFCVVEMSNFYLDIIKDRLYCEETNGLKRRSAQTAMYIILDAMVKMLAPILCFTADEIWQAMPHKASDNAENVVFNLMPEPYNEYALTDEQIAAWENNIALRDDLNLILEAARAEKLIGKPLEAHVVLYAEGDEYKKLCEAKELIKTMLIVSEVSVKEGQGGTVCQNHANIAAEVIKADGEKCERCWTYTHDVGRNASHPTLCARCAAVVNAQ